MDSFITAKLNSLRFTFNRMTLIELLRWANELTAATSNTNPTTTANTPGSPSKSLQRSNSLLTKSVKESQVLLSSTRERSLSSANLAAPATNPHSTVTKMQMSFTFKSMDVVLNKEGKKIAYCSLHSTSAVLRYRFSLSDISSSYFASSHLIPL